MGNRREFTASHTRAATTLEAAHQMLMPYRHNKMAAIRQGFQFRPGFLYTQTRAIAARINQNFDGWPSSELKKSYRTFIGKPCFVNHQNFDPRKARGKVIAARYIENGRDKYVDVIQEIDAARFPKLAHEIISGGLDSVSMGVEAGFTICSYCGNKAVDEDEFCSHVKYHKGRVLPRINARTGAHEDVLVYEKCHKLGFFELSFVFDPADETAVVSRVLHANRHGAKGEYGPGGPGYQGGGSYDKENRGVWHQDDVPVSPVMGELEGLGWLHRRIPYSAEHAVKHEGWKWVPHRDEDWEMDPNDPRLTASPAPIHRARIAQGQQQQIPGELQTYVDFPYVDMPPVSMPEASRRYADADLHSGPGYSGPDTPYRSDDPTHGPNMNPPWYRAPLQQSVPSQKQIMPPGMGAPSDYRAGSYHFGYGESDQPPDDGDCFCTCDDHDHEHWEATGEEAPEDIDTLRDDDGSDDGDFKHYVESPKELEGPDLDQTKRLDRAQEQEGLDTQRRVEDVEDIGGLPMASRSARRRRTQKRARMSNVLMDPRTGRRYYAADDFPPPEDDFGGGGPPPDDGGGDLPPWLQGDQGDGGPPPDEDEDEGYGGDEGAEDEGDEGDGGPPPDESDEDLISEAEEDLERAEEEEGGGDEYGGPEDEEEGEYGPEGGEEEEPEQGGGGLPPEFLARRHGNYRSSDQKKRRARRGRPMSLAQRHRVASVGRRVHYADDSGYFDGGPYGEDNQGVKEDTFISQTPGAESFDPPQPGDSPISNTENNLVARIMRRNAEQRRDMIAYEQITGRRIGKEEPNPWKDWPTNEKIDPSSAQAGLQAAGSRRGPRRYYGEATEIPTEVNPTVNTGSAGEAETGDSFESLGEPPTETDPGHTASLAPFQAFNTWLYNTTGRTARQHASPDFIRRQAARYCQATGYTVESLFPALGMVLREARTNERRRTAMRYADVQDSNLDAAAPQDREDVEAPVSDTTNALAQASQPNEGDFGNNAGDDLAEPVLDTDSQIWAPGETPEGFSTKSSNRRADGITAVRYAEAFITAGLAPNTPEEKWRIAGLAQTMRHGTIVDRIRLLDAVNTVHMASRRRTAGVSGAGRGIPQGFGGRQMTAVNGGGAASDIATDSAIFLK